MKTHLDGFMNPWGYTRLATNDARQSLPDEDRQSLPHAPRGRARVLIIEDNVDAAETLREALELSGHEVRVAYSGPEGLALARKTPPDVLLCDLGLPGIDGFDVARAFRADEALSRTFLVALTGYSLPDHRRRAREAGFDRHIAKPPQLGKLDALITSACAPLGHRARAEEAEATG